jgi:hypothetical protein
MMHMSGARLVAAFVVVFVVGCGGPPPKPSGVEVGGKILLATGAPLTGGTLVLRPVGGIHGASAKIEPNGTFALVDPSGDKSVVPGKYQAYVTFNDPSHIKLRYAVNKKYQNTEDGDSDVIVEITVSTNDLLIKFNK